MAALAITEGKLAANSVATAKIIDLAVTAAKIAAAAITEEKVAGEAISTAKIKALAVTAAKLAAEAVETGKIATAAVTAAKIAASAVEEAKIKDAAVTSRKAKLTCGIEEATGDLVLKEETQDVPGASLAITPAVASKLLVTAVFDFELDDSSGGGVFGVGLLNVDGVAQGPTAVHAVVNGVGDNGVSRATVSQVYSLSLTAAAHTVKLRANKQGVGTGECLKGNTNLSYMLVAS